VTCYPCWSTSLKTAPVEEPIGLDDAKAQCRIDTAVSDEDALVTGLIQAAREWAETFTSRAFVSQVWYLRLSGFPYDAPIWLPRPPLVSIASVTYVDTNGATQTWSTYDLSQPAGPHAAYARLQPVYGAVFPIARPQLEAVTVEYTCGYGSATAVPQAIKQALLLLVAHLYRNREAVSMGSGVGYQDLPLGAASLLSPFVVQRW
jgi:uncharacterized phiE125 gp8 family phage protein